MQQSNNHGTRNVDRTYGQRHRIAVARQNEKRNQKAPRYLPIRPVRKHRAEGGTQACACAKQHPRSVFMAMLEISSGCGENLNAGSLTLEQDFFWQHAVHPGLQNEIVDLGTCPPSLCEIMYGGESPALKCLLATRAAAGRRVG